MSAGGRSWFEEYLYRRSRQGPSPEQEEPHDPRRRLNRVLLLLGVVVPMAFCYGLGALYFGKNGNAAGYWLARSLGAATWLGFAAALSVRRDWRGAGVISGVYILFDAWLWMTVMP